jgi:hypothetical protein
MPHQRISCETGKPQNDSSKADFLTETAGRCTLSGRGWIPRSNQTTPPVIPKYCRQLKFDERLGVRPRDIFRLRGWNCLMCHPHFPRQLHACCEQKPVRSWCICVSDRRLCSHSVCYILSTKFPTILQKIEFITTMIYMNG